MGKIKQISPDLNGRPRSTADSGGEPLGPCEPIYMTFRLPNADAAARAALESVAARTLTDTEWERSRARLVEFVNILRLWDRQAHGRRKCKPEVVAIGAKDRESVLEKEAA